MLPQDVTFLRSVYHLLSKDKIIYEEFPSPPIPFSHPSTTTSNTYFGHKYIYSKFLSFHVVVEALYTNQTPSDHQIKRGNISLQY